MVPTKTVWQWHCKPCLYRCCEQIVRKWVCKKMGGAQYSVIFIRKKCPHHFWKQSDAHASNISRWVIHRHAQYFLKHTLQMHTKRFTTLLLITQETLCRQCVSLSFFERVCSMLLNLQAPNIIHTVNNYHNPSLCAIYISWDVLK